MPVKVHLAKKVSLAKNRHVQERIDYKKKMYDKYPFVAGSESTSLMDFFQENLKNNDLRVLQGFFASGLEVR